MSLPTRAVVYDVIGKQIGTIFYNVGWVWDELTVVTDVSKMFAYNPTANEIVLYGTTYHRDTIDSVVAEVQKSNDEYRKKMLERSKALREQLDSRSSSDLRVMMDMTEKSMPTLIAEQIVGVQPMASENGSALMHPIKMRLREDIDDTQHFDLD